MLPKVRLPNTDLNVSQICYGTNRFGTEIGQEQAEAILDRFVQWGGNFIDTARSYGDWVPEAPAGASERVIGQWLKSQDRDSIVISTKGGLVDMRKWDPRTDIRTLDAPNRVTPQDIADDLTESLEHLGVEHIDLYWVHSDNPEVSVEPIIDSLLEHQAAGRIRYFGASNWTASRIAEANSYAASIGRNGFVASQPFWGLAVPDREASAAQGFVNYYENQHEELHAQGLPVIPFSSQSGGYFTKLATGGEEAVAEPLRSRYANPVNRDRLAAIQTIANKRAASINEIVLAYLLSQPNLTIPIIGAGKPDQIDESIKAVFLKLTIDELAQLRG